MSQNVFEIVEFKLVQGVSESDLMPLSDAFQAFLQEQPGFLYRSLATHQNGNGYVDVSYWQSIEDLNMVEKAFKESEACIAFLKVIDEQSVTMTQHNIIAQTQCSS
ncbi:hypothetical protein PSECIP111951_00058 [Pseudoalteromonas holothuriae]|uniref:ABM domain-containing protein n=1 Tax=Pseudoalteromonas holothuriae TaxID=2963714 RepID=A0A9W4QU66_9GAMM|nr:MULTISPECIES: hypothetical protein [unclassified Pseudoalteromonas]CAH9049863.1 hypothetical protein PSECIP111951_00058 [Pseudoalteromonas sp. CIP111951]CAH9052890.1 hypothetical protein PSECIP111854_01062 [Pseudoalteromonas sp. CIP111854]